MELDEVSGDERQQKRTFACFWKGLHESVAIRRKSGGRAHCRANGRSESEMGPWNLDWHRMAPKEKFLIRELEKARDLPCSDVAENLKSAIEMHQDHGSSGHRRVRLTTKIVMRVGATPGCRGCVGSRSHTEACRMRSRRTLADAKESESSRAVGAGVGSIAKMTVELQQPTAVIQQEPSLFFSLTAPMQEPTQDIQNELMYSPMELGAQEHREQRRVRLNETLPSEMSKRPVVKANPAHSSMIAPMMESLGLTDLLDPAPYSSCPRGGCVAVRGDENVRERDSVSRRRTGISCDCEP